MVPMWMRHEMKPEELAGRGGFVSIGGVPRSNQEVSQLKGMFSRALHVKSCLKCEEQ
jgi:hypothetical protein